MNWNIVFYRKENGDTPAFDFIKSLPEKLMAKTFSEIELLEKFGTHLKEPYVKSIQGKRYDGLWELRVKFSSDNVRIFYFTFHANTFVLLNGFLKKSNTTPKRELERALQYMNDYKRRALK